MTLHETLLKDSIFSVEKLEKKLGGWLSGFFFLCNHAISLWKYPGFQSYASLGYRISKITVLKISISHMKDHIGVLPASQSLLPKSSRHVQSYSMEVQVTG